MGGGTLEKHHLWIKESTSCPSHLGTHVKEAGRCST